MITALRPHQGNLSFGQQTRRWGERDFQGMGGGFLLVYFWVALNLTCREMERELEGVWFGWFFHYFGLVFECFEVFLCVLVCLRLFFSQFGVFDFGGFGCCWFGK